MTQRLDVPRFTARHGALGLATVFAAVVVGLAVGPIAIGPHRIAADALDHLPFVSMDSGLTANQEAIVWQVRAPRVALGMMVGALLAGSGAAYQGVFRNPLADPYLLGVAAGAGLGATLAIVSGVGDAAGVADMVPLAAFAGGLVAVAAASLLGARPGRPGPVATLLLAGVVVASFLTAVQTFVQQRNADTLREVYAWILGRLTTSGWTEVLLLLPYAVVTTVVLLAAVGPLDVLAVGEEEAAMLGLRPEHVRNVVLVAASLAAAAAVAVSGLIGFVGLVVPHAVRLVAGTSNRVVVPLSLLVGGAFLTFADLAARTVDAPAELPIGVVTAFLGAPFFALLLRLQRVGA